MVTVQIWYLTTGVTVSLNMEAETVLVSPVFTFFQVTVQTVYRYISHDILQIWNRLLPYTKFLNLLLVSFNNGNSTFFVNTSMVTATDPCADAMCQTNNICFFGNMPDSCNCSEPWVGPSCNSSEFGESGFFCISWLWPYYCGRIKVHLDLVHKEPRR